MSLTEPQIERYSRQILLPQVGGEGQERLLESRILVVGVGGLGCPAAQYLAAAGVGRIGLIDGDCVEPANLPRQILYSDADVGRAKVEAAAEKLSTLNPDVTVHTVPEQLTRENGCSTVGEYDFVIDGTDRFTGKCLVAWACHRQRIPYCHAGVERFRVQIMTVQPARTACLRCILPATAARESETPCRRGGMLGPLTGLVGTMQAVEAMKYLLGMGELLTNTVLTCDGLAMDFRRIRVKMNPDCPLCGHGLNRIPADTGAPDSVRSCRDPSCRCNR